MAFVDSYKRAFHPRHLDPSILIFRLFLSSKAALITVRTAKIGPIVSGGNEWLVPMSRIQGRLCERWGFAVQRHRVRLSAPVWDRLTNLSFVRLGGDESLKM